MDYFAGVVMIGGAIVLLCIGPLAWRHDRWNRSFAIRHAATMMGHCFRIIRASLWVSWWLMKTELEYLHAKFRGQRQEGDMMVDLEMVFSGLDNYFHGRMIRSHKGLPTPVPSAEADPEPAVGDDANMPEMFRGGADMVNPAACLEVEWSRYMRHRLHGR